MQAQVPESLPTLGLPGAEAPGQASAAGRGLLEAGEEAGGEAADAVKMEEGGPASLPA